MTAPLTLFGGTFDPVHLGHLQVATEAARQADLDKVYLLPCHIPPHKAGPHASPAHRLAMLQRVCQEWPLFEVDDRELRQHRPSYTVETLRQCRAQDSHRPIIFILGMDSLKNLNTWFQWQELMSLCHLLVCRRGNCEEDFNLDIKALLARHQTQDPEHLKRQPCGHILLADTSIISQSSSQVRRALIQGNTPALLPACVLAYIQQHQLYQGCKKTPASGRPC